MGDKTQSGFTLIELSIVLAIIGLVVGGVLVGQDLIRAAYVRAQLTQIEKFNTAVNTFYIKYQALPGDMNATVAEANGFTPRGALPGQGDGNGLLEGNYTGDPVGDPYSSASGECAAFWSDLTYANGMNLNLIDGIFTTAPATTQGVFVGGSNLTPYFPASKLGQGNYLYVWSGGGSNYYGLSFGSTIRSGDINSGADTDGAVASPNPGLTVNQAYRLDGKVDDGLPQSGNVQAMYIDYSKSAESISLVGYPGSASSNGPVWAGGGSATGGASPGTSATASPTTCYDNGGGTGPMAYSTAVNGGNGGNCALSFRFQAGD